MSAPRLPSIAGVSTLVLTTLLFLVGLGSPSAKASSGAPLRVAVGEMSVPDGQRELLPEVTDAVHQALGVMPGVRLTSSRRAEVVVRGSLTRLVEREGEVRAEVSIIVAERRSGSVRLLLDGRATARGGGSLRPGAIRAAVRGALRPLGQRRAPLARR